jgi:hypothetical protein
MGFGQWSNELGEPVGVVGAEVIPGGRGGGVRLLLNAVSRGLTFDGEGGAWVEPAAGLEIQPSLLPGFIRPAAADGQGLAVGVTGGDLQPSGLGPV